MIYFLALYCYYIFVVMDNFKKYIFLFLGICVFWIGVIPFVFSKAIPVVCENLTYNSVYNLEVKNPRLILSLIPSAIIKADELDIKLKNQQDAAKIVSPKINIRLLPLLVGKVHINKISAKDVYLNTRISENPVLEKDFVNKLVKKNNFKLNAVKIENFKVELSQKGLSSPVLYKGNSVHFRKNGRYVKISLVSALEVQDKISEINAKLFLPKNNDVKEPNSFRT